MTVRQEYRQPRSEATKRMLQCVVGVIGFAIPILGQLARSPNLGKLGGWLGFLAYPIPLWILPLPVLLYMLCIWLIELIRDNWEAPVFPSEVARETINRQQEHI